MFLLRLEVYVSNVVLQTVCVDCSFTGAGLYHLISLHVGSSYSCKREVNHSSSKPTCPDPYYHNNILLDWFGSRFPFPCMGGESREGVFMPVNGCFMPMGLCPLALGRWVAWSQECILGSFFPLVSGLFVWWSIPCRVVSASFQGRG